MDIVVTCCIQQNDTLLMVQEAKPKAYGLWNFPSGKIEPCEDVFVGAIREVKEETGYDVRLTNLLSIHNCIHKEYPILRLAFYAEIVSGSIAFNRDEILQVRWVPLLEIEQMGELLRRPESTAVLIEAVKRNLGFPLDVLRNITTNK